jgi:hypothetical protein
MLKMGIAKDAVAQKMVMDEVDPRKLGLGEEEDNDPALLKYKKMLQMGIAKEAVAQKMVMDSVDPKRLNLKPPADATSVKMKTSATDVLLSLKKTGQPAASRPKRRKLHWETIKGAVARKGSIWHSHSAEGDAVVAAASTPAGSSAPLSTKQHDSLLLHDFEELFVSAASPTTKGAQESTKKKAKKASVVHVIDPQRCMNGGIALARIRLTPALLGNRLTTLDPACELAAEQLEAALTLVPTAKEAAQLQRFRGPVGSLSECEQAMLTLLAVPQASARIEALLFMRSLDESAAFLSAQAAAVRTACALLVQSPPLRRVFHFVLLLGNRLNHEEGGRSTSRPSSPTTSVAGGFAGEESGAQAFTLRSLLNLANTKAFDGRTTVLEYLVRVLERAQGEGSGGGDQGEAGGGGGGACDGERELSLLDFAVGLERCVADARRVSLDAAEAEVRKLQAGREKVAALASAMGDERRAWRLGRRLGVSLRRLPRPQLHRAARALRARRCRHFSRRGHNRAGVRGPRGPVQGQAPCRLRPPPNRLLALHLLMAHRTTPMQKSPSTAPSFLPLWRASRKCRGLSCRWSS